MTPDEWRQRIGGAIDDAVQTLANICPIGRPAWLGNFEHRVAAQWRKVFEDILSGEEVDSLVDNIVGTIQSRLADVERGGATLH